MKGQEEYVHVYVHLKLSTPCIVKVICFHGNVQDWAKNNHNKEQHTLFEDDPAFFSLHLRFTKRKFQRLISIMDRLAQHFLNRGGAKDDDGYSRSSSHNAIPLIMALGKTLVSRGEEERRGRSRHQKSERVNLQRLGEYVVDLMERAEGRERGRGDDEKHDIGDEEEERRRVRRDGRRHGHEHGEGKRRRRRRRRSHEEEYYEKPRESDQEQHHHHDQQTHEHEQIKHPEEQDQHPKDLHNTTNPNYPYISIPSLPPSHQHRHRRSSKLDALRTELEAMSDTLTDLNSRSASHSDCEFYDKFVEKGGRLQEAIGETLGRMRDVEEGEGRRRRRRRSRGRI